MATKQSSETLPYRDEVDLVASREEAEELGAFVMEVRDRSSTHLVILGPTSNYATRSQPRSSRRRRWCNIGPLESRLPLRSRTSRRGVRALPPTRQYHV